MSPDEFATILQKYSIDDFINKEGKPYQELMNASQARMGMFEQYQAVLLNYVHGICKDKDIIKAIYERLSIGWTVLYNQDISNNIDSYITIVQQDETKTDKVSVLPLICGSGKSTALSFRVINTIIRVEGAQLDTKDIRSGLYSPEQISEVPEQAFDGLLIVTDSKERLRKIWEPDLTNKHFVKEDRMFIENHKNWVSIITEENVDEEERKQRYAPVLCVTTQRYFGWKREEILRHLEWEDAYGVHKRPLIIFDEQPYLNEVKDISVKTINDIDTALRESLDDEVSYEEKQWCVRQWSLFRDSFFELLSYYENGFDGLDTLYYEPETHSITEDDNKFFAIIEKYRKKIRVRYNDAYNSLYVVKQFVNSWSIFCHRSIDSGEYSNKFTVYIDNREKVTNLEAKVVVLDGTGDISPIYSEQDYVDIYNGENFLRSLSYLTIRHGNFGTSKEDFRKKEINVGKTILSYLKQQGYEKKDMIFFTYKGKEGKFKAQINIEGKRISNVAHFGDIRGKNDFTKWNSFAQVGINRMQPVHYLVHVLGRYPEMRQDLARREPDSMYEQINTIYQGDRYIDFVTAHVLADIDQCMFRSAIRNADNLKNVVYYLFYKNSHYPRLKKAIEERYKKKLGANIETISERDILDAMGAWKITWRLYQWLSEWDGELVKQKNLLTELAINRDSFNSALRRDYELAAMFKQLRQNANNMGKRGAWYTKRVQT